MVAPPALAMLAERWDAIPADKRAHVAALLTAAAEYAGLPASALPPCAWRGELIERCPCGNPLRDVWQCAKSEGPVTGKLCAQCRYAKSE